MAFKKWTTTNKEYTICPECKGKSFVSKTGPNDYYETSKCEFCDGKRVVIRGIETITEYSIVSEENNVH